MENQTETVGNQIAPENSGIETQYIISLEKFIILNLVTLNLYSYWWTYKEWRFLKQKENIDIMPAGRAILSIFFLYFLFERIIRFAKQKGYADNYFPLLLFCCYLSFYVVNRLPEPYSFLIMLLFTVFIPPFNALNYAKRHSSDFTVVEQTSFNGRQITLIVCGVIFWTLVIIGKSME